MAPADFFNGADKRTGERRIAITPHPHTSADPCPGGCKDIEIVAQVVGQAKSDLGAFEIRMQEMHDQALRLDTRLDENKDRMSRMEDLMASNAAVLSRNTLDTAEILSIIRDTKTGIRFAGYFWTAAKWLTGFGLTLIALYFTVKNGSK